MYQQNLDKYSQIDFLSFTKKCYRFSIFQLILFFEESVSPLYVFGHFLLEKKYILHVDCNLLGRSIHVRVFKKNTGEVFDNVTLTHLLYDIKDVFDSGLILKKVSKTKMFK